MEENKEKSVTEEMDAGTEIPIEGDEPETEEIPETETAAEEPQTEVPEEEEIEEEIPEEETGSDPEDAGEKPQEAVEEPAEGKKKTSFFGRKKKENDKYQQQIDDLTDRLKRSLAEFDNFRKRTDKEKASMYVIGARDVIEKILPVVDNFERGLTQAQEGDAFADGMKMIYKQLMTCLEELGVKPIEAVGQEFNPDLHNAVMHVDDENAGDNIVVEEFQKGYTYKDFVVRHSMVKVAN